MSLRISDSFIDDQEPISKWLLVMNHTSIIESLITLYIFLQGHCTKAPPIFNTCTLETLLTP